MFTGINLYHTPNKLSWQSLFKINRGCYSSKIIDRKIKKKKNCWMTVMCRGKDTNISLIFVSCEKSYAMPGGKLKHHAHPPAGDKNE